MPLHLDNKKQKRIDNDGIESFKKLYINDVKIPELFMLENLFLMIIHGVRESFYTNLKEWTLQLQFFTHE